MKVVNIDTNNLDILINNIKDIVSKIEDIKNFVIIVEDKYKFVQLRRFGDPLQQLMLLNYYKEKLLNDEFSQDSYVFSGD